MFTTTNMDKWTHELEARFTELKRLHEAEEFAEMLRHWHGEAVSCCKSPCWSTYACLFCLPRLVFLTLLSACNSTGELFFDVFGGKDEEEKARIIKEYGSGNEFKRETQVTGFFLIFIVCLVLLRVALFSQYWLKGPTLKKEFLLGMPAGLELVLPDGYHIEDQAITVEFTDPVSCLLF